MGCVYCAKNLINGKCYVGKTCGPFNQRIHDHLYESSKRHPRYLLHRAINKHGVNKFEWLPLFEDQDEALLFEQEKKYIKELGTRTPNGYNLTDGGEGPSGSVPSKESINKRICTRRRQSEIYGRISIIPIDELECHKVYSQVYYRVNKTKIQAQLKKDEIKTKAFSKNYYDLNKEKSRLYYLDNKNRLNQQSKEWKKVNAEKRRQYGIEYRKRKSLEQRQSI